MGKIYSLKGIELSDKEIAVLTSSPTQYIQQEVSIILHNVLIGDELEALFSGMKEHKASLLNALEGLPIPLERKRAIYTIATFCGPIINLDIPEDFLSDKSQDIRTKAYLLSQAYYSSRAISMGYSAVGNDPSYYKELPNLLFILHSLHNIGVSPKDIWSASPFDSFIEESGRVINQINEGIRHMYIPNTPELRELLGLSIRSVG